MKLELGKYKVAIVANVKVFLQASLRFKNKFDNVDLKCLDCHFE